MNKIVPIVKQQTVSFLARIIHEASAASADTRLRAFATNLHEYCGLGVWFLIPLLVLCSGLAYAEWVAIDKDFLRPGFQTVYVDLDTRQREGNLVTIWQLIDFKWMQGSARGPARFSSTKTYKQFDCMENRVRLLGFTEYSLQMGTGIRSDGYIDKGNWLAVEPESINHALWILACDKK